MHFFLSKLVNKYKKKLFSSTFIYFIIFYLLLPFSVPKHTCAPESHGPKRACFSLDDTFQFVTSLPYF